jgi:hypothetical protein
MARLLSLLTWLQRRIQAILGVVISRSVGLLAFVLRRGRHRDWRQEQDRKARRGADASE